MKKFIFSLDRVLRWRATQLHLAESRLEQLKGALRQTESMLVQVAEDRERTLSEILSRSLLESTDFESLEQARQYAIRETARLQQLRERFTGEVRTQIEEVRERRRQMQLLERLREKRYAEWELAAAAELRQLTEDSHLSKLVRESLDAESSPDSAS